MHQEWRVNAEFENKPKDKLCLHKRLSEGVGGQSNVTREQFEEEFNYLPITRALMKSPQLCSYSLDMDNNSTLSPQTRVDGKIQMGVWEQVALDDVLVSYDKHHKNENVKQQS